MTGFLVCAVQKVTVQLSRVTVLIMLPHFLVASLLAIHP